MKTNELLSSVVDARDAMDKLTNPYSMLMACLSLKQRDKVAARRVCHVFDLARNEFRLTADMIDSNALIGYNDQADVKLCLGKIWGLSYSMLNSVELLKRYTFDGYPDREHNALVVFELECVLVALKNGFVKRAEGI